MDMIDGMIDDIKTNDPEGWQQAKEESCEMLGHLILPGETKCCCGLVKKNERRT